MLIPLHELFFSPQHCRIAAQQVAAQQLAAQLQQVGLAAAVSGIPSNESQICRVVICLLTWLWQIESFFVLLLAQDCFQKDQSWSLAMSRPDYIHRLNMPGAPYSASGSVL